MWPKAEVIYVNGNHEFYCLRRKDVLAMHRITAKETGMHFLENDVVENAGISFLGCMLWIVFNLIGEDTKHWCLRDTQQGLNDFRVTHEGNRHFSPIDSVVLHESSVAWLEQKLKHEQFCGKTVVVTHHLPSMKSVTERYELAFDHY